VNISLNDETREVLDDCNLDEALNALGFSSINGCAVALNEEVIPRENWVGRKLNNDDRILIVQATQGG
jgi:sulfur carrier protein